jgi:hypothetical protein
MKSIALLVVVSALLTAALVAPSADASRSWDYRCGSQPQVGAGWYNVRANNVRCSTARHVAKHHWKTGDDHFQGWGCDTDRLGIELFRADCARTRLFGAHQHVRFRFGS